MKPFQIYRATKWPELTETLANSVQLTLFDGCIRELKTQIHPMSSQICDGFDEFRIFHEMEEKKIGYTSVMSGGGFRDVKFSSYIFPSEFPAYYCEEEKIFIVNSSKKICRSLFKQIAKLFKQISIEERDFEFSKASHLINEYLGVWFRNISPNVQSASLHGNEIQKDSNFERFLSVGDVSNITIPFEFDGAVHKVMLTSSSAVVFVQNYENTQIELGLLMKVYKELILPTWKLCYQET